MQLKKNIKAENSLNLFLFVYLFTIIIIFKGSAEINLDGSNTDIKILDCLLYTSPSPRDVEESRMPSSA